MSVIREDGLEHFLKRQLSAFNGILVHGADSAAVATIGRQVSKAVAGGGSIERFEVGAIKDGAGRIEDEFRSLSLLGDRRVLVLDAATDGALKALEPVIQSSSVGNFVVLLADALGKSSKLRNACEEAAKFAALAIYEEDAEAMRQRIAKYLVSVGLRWEGEAESVFFELAGTERSIALQEIEKVATYCHGQKVISEVDVLAICGDLASFGTDDVIDAMLAGDMNATDRAMAGLESDSAGMKGLLQVTLSHLTRLQELRGAIDRGSNVELAVRNAKPVIFFKRRSAIQMQLRKFALDDLIVLQQSLNSAIFQSRANADLADAVTSRALLSLARLARSKLG